MILLSRPTETKTMMSASHKLSFLLFVSLALCRSVDSASSNVSHDSASGSSRRRHQRTKGAGHRRLEEPYFNFEKDVDLSGYSLQFVSCRDNFVRADEEEVEEFEMDDDLEEEDEGEYEYEVVGNKWPNRRRLDAYEEEEPKRLVSFQFCDSIWSGRCASPYGEMAVDLGTYLEMTLSYKMDVQERYCELCNECYEMGTANLNGAEEMPSLLKRCNGIDTSACYAECQNIENMEENGYLDASEFTECVGIDYEDEDGNEFMYYAGPMCADSGSRIKIGIFTDEECTIVDESQEIENLLKNEDGYSMKLSYHLLKQSFDECGVADCLFEDEDEDEDGVQMGNGNHNFNGNEVQMDNGNNNFTNLFEQESRPPIPQTKEVCKDLLELSTIQGHMLYDDDDLIADDDFTDDHTVASSSCVRADGDIFYAGKFCEFQSTSICGVNAAKNRTQFCTNDGECAMIPSDSDDLFFDDSLDIDDVEYDEYFCICPYGYNGDFCELVVPGLLQPSQTTSIEFEGKEMFQRFDTDGSSYLERDEIEAMGADFVGGNPPPQSMIIGILESFDRDFDGRLSWEEFEKGLLAPTVSDDDDEASYLAVDDFFGSTMNFTQRERNSLRSFYIATQGDNWENDELWLTETNYCNWYGVTCNRGGSVIVLDLSRNSVQGYNGLDILGQLSNLTMLDLSSNQLTGPLPWYLGGLYQLKKLNLSNNSLTGEWPSTSNLLPELQSLDISFNLFTGMLPLIKVAYYNLEINVVGNYFSGIDPLACTHDWNNGATVSFGCDGIACANGTSNSEGRQITVDNPCVDCSLAIFFGNVGCTEYQNDSSPFDDAGWLEEEDEEPDHDAALSWQIDEPGGAQVEYEFGSSTTPPGGQWNASSAVVPADTAFTSDSSTPIPSDSPSFEPSSAPSNQPTVEPTGFVDPLAPNRNTGQNVLPDWQTIPLLLLLVLLF